MTEFTERPLITGLPPYKVITTDHLQSLELLVEVEILQNYIPIGGIAVVYRPDTATTHYYQAMIRRSPEE